MRNLTLQELWTVTAANTQRFKTLRRRGLLALAFGRGMAFESFAYVELDAVAYLLAETISKSYSRPVAAQLVRCECDTWSTAVAMSEAVPLEPAAWCIVDFTNKDGKLAHLTCATNSTDADEIATRLSMTPQAFGASAQRVTIVNVRPLLNVIIKTAAARGIDLTRPFLPPFGSPEFNELFAPYAEMRDAAVDAVEVQATKDALARAAGRKVREIAEAKLDRTVN